jgi:predicted DNA-binding protein (MmcQ/YjbR family)
LKPTKKSDPLGWLRKRCEALGGIEERPAWGHPTFRAGTTTIAAFETFHGRPSIAVLADRERQDVLITKFGLFKTPYAGKSGWVSAWVDQPVQWDLLADLLTDAHRAATAPRPKKPRRGRAS